MKVLLIGLILTVCKSVVMANRFAVKTINRKHHWHSNDDKIFQGSYVEDMKHYAYMVSIKIYTSHICGGGLITLNFVVTACHCVAAIPEDKPGPAEPFKKLKLSAYTFVAGTRNIEDYEATAQIGSAKSVHYHPQCQNAKSLIYDHALAKMQNPFHQTPFVQPLKMYTWDKQEFRKLFIKMFSQGKELKCVVAGWGDTRRGVNNPELASARLKSIQMLVLSEKDCSKTWASLNPSIFKGFDFWKYGEICALSKHRNGSDCVGDSGSPYVCDGHLIATVSYGAEDCGEGIPSVYATVAELLDWINKDFADEIRGEKTTADKGTGQQSSSPAMQSSETRSSSPISSTSTEISHAKKKEDGMRSQDEQKISVNSNQRSISSSLILIAVLIRLAIEK